MNVRLTRERLTIAICTLGAGGTALAQSGDPAGAASPEMVPLTQVLAEGGPIMKVLLALSVVAIFLAIYFLLSIRRSVLVPERFREEAESAAEQGDVEALHRICAENDSAAARVVRAATRTLQANPDAEYLVLRDVVEDEGKRQASALWQRIQYLMDIVTVAPMLGLLGTVWGMILMFADIQEQHGLQGMNPALMADGVKVALNTTAGGLAVGLVAMVLYVYFRGRVSRTVSHLEETCSLLVQRVMATSRQGGVPMGVPANGRNQASSAPRPTKGP